MSTSVEIIGFGEKDRLWRWDTNRQIRIIPETGATIDEIRFSNVFFEKPLKVEPKTNEYGDIVADIPNILLQDIFPIDVQVIMFFNNGKQTIYNTSYKVENCKKPPEYVYTETEIKNYDDLEKRIEKLEKSGGAGGQGTDGFSPIASVEQTEEGAEITITDKYGTTQATIKHGKNGQDGKDGYTPVKGVDYFDGKNGADGTSVTVKNVSESTADGGNNVVTFSDGKTVTIKNGSKGSKGDKGEQGIQGEKGADGYTPQKNVDYFDGKDGKDGQNGKDGVNGKDGADGKTPIKGTDYFTQADKAELVTDVLNALPTWQGGAY